MVLIGKTYLDIWGGLHEIHGYVVVSRGFRNEVKFDKSLVWSTSSHFHVESGKNAYGGLNLVVLPPKKEIAYWKRFIQQIKSVNSDDKIKLVQPLLDNIAARINELEASK